MTRKWKAIIWCIVTYQLILTAMMFKLHHYAQWLYFDTELTKWYEGPKTAPQREAIMYVGITLLFMIAIVIIAHRVDVSDAKENASSSD